jgi:hypothetical protein
VEVAAWAERGVKPASALGAAAAGRGADRFIAVDASLRGLLPDGLARGSTVVVAGDGTGRTSLVLSLLVEATRAGSWSAIVGMPAVSLAAASWLGADLGRVVVVPEPGPDVAAVAATLVDGVDVVALAVPGGLPASMYTQLSARARNAGSVLVAMSAWPAASMVLTVQDGQWYGRGRLRCRRLTVAVSGRGAAGRPRQGQVWLPADPDLQRTLDLAPAEGARPGRLRVVA